MAWLSGLPLACHSCPRVSLVFFRVLLAWGTGLPAAPGLESVEIGMHTTNDEGYYVQRSLYESQQGFSLVRGLVVQPGAVIVNSKYLGSK